MHNSVEMHQPIFVSADKSNYFHYRPSADCLKKQLMIRAILCQSNRGGKMCEKKISRVEFSELT